MDETVDWSELMSRMRLQLYQCAREPEKAKDGIYHVLEDLEKLDRLLRGAAAEPAISARRSRPRGPRTPQNEYRIEETKRGPCLAEYFAPDKPPFRCEKKVYDAVASVLAEQDDAVSIEDLVRRVRKSTRSDLPDYLVRECIRFWMSRQPPLIEKVGTRYRAIKKTSLRPEARKTWTDLESRP